MKQYLITLGDRTFDVKVLSDPLQEQVQVEVDGERLTVWIKTVSPAAETSVADATPGATAMPSPAAAPPSAPTRSAAASIRTVTAPLPGVIKSIRVRPGQQVSANDEIVVIEAMKMDNIIRAQRPGIISYVYVTEGRQVAHGEPLLDYAD